MFPKAYYTYYTFNTYGTTIFLTLSNPRGGALTLTEPRTKGIGNQRSRSHETKDRFGSTVIDRFGSSSFFSSCNYYNYDLM